MADLSENKNEIMDRVHMVMDKACDYRNKYEEKFLTFKD